MLYSSIRQPTFQWDITLIAKRSRTAAVHTARNFKVYLDCAWAWVDGRTKLEPNSDRRKSPLTPARCLVCDDAGRRKLALIFIVTMTNVYKQ